MPSDLTIFVANCEVITMESFLVAHALAKIGLIRSSSDFRHVKELAKDGGAWKKKDNELKTRRVTCI